jgi:hypothetical protein
LLIRGNCQISTASQFVKVNRINTDPLGKPAFSPVFEGKTGGFGPKRAVFGGQNSAPLASQRISRNRPQQERRFRQALKWVLEDRTRLWPGGFPSDASKLRRGTSQTMIPKLKRMQEVQNFVG